MWHVQGRGQGGKRRGRRSKFLAAIMEPSRMQKPIIDYPNRQFSLPPKCFSGCAPDEDAIRFKAGISESISVTLNLEYSFKRQWQLRLL